MSTDLGTLPITVTATADDLAGNPDTAATFSFELSGAVAADGTPIADPTTVATLADNGDGTATLTEAAGAPAGASVNLDALATDPAGTPAVSSAASGDTLTFTVPVVVVPPTSNVSKVLLTVTNDPNLPVLAGAAAEAPAAAAADAAEEAAEPVTAAEEAEVPAPPTTPGVAENQGPAVNEAGIPV